ncbi:type II secretion system minor pseudopilin GspH [Bordetella petrii]|uniref:type II secretion system minor pseudopilin GspH n=1 Tax=Bordetella petrii TaxID=94624 RepID=UPI001E5A0117|nr:type II secretion system minor pseudopilin GspH [Bordetella petrii]MCD0506188.1 type II secretion system minor pseudopilin GspH [Bordetella petrii]
MPTSVRGTSERGFTLIEMLVVVAIIAIAASMVSLSVASSSARALQSDAQRLVDAFAVAQSEARSDGRVIRWRADERGWSFERRGRSPRLSAQDDGPQAPDRFEQDAALRPQAWRAPPVAMRLDPARPVIFGTEWISDPLVLELASGGDTVRIERDAAGGYAIQ